MSLSPIIEAIARENFRSSGFVSRPDDGRRPAGGIIKRRLRATFNADLVHDALQRREQARMRLDRAVQRENRLTAGLRNWMDVVLRK